MQLSANSQFLFLNFLFTISSFRCIIIMDYKDSCKTIGCHIYYVMFKENAL